MVQKMQQRINMSFVVALLVVTNALAEVPAAQLQELAHLMMFMENTDCILERNGTKYSGKEALTHVKRKYDYFIDEIHSTEDFIKYSATKSEMSGKYYQAHCTGEASMKLSDWLYQELESYRQKNNLKQNTPAS